MKDTYKRPSVLSIQSLLNTTTTTYTTSEEEEEEEEKTPSPCTLYHQHQYSSSSSSLLSDDIAAAVNIKDQVHKLIHQVNKEKYHSEDDEEEEDSAIKAKRRRANAKQLEVLNRVFDRTFFPSTQMRAELGRQLGMSPRTVQIWFQNRRQAMRTRERQKSNKQQ